MSLNCLKYNEPVVFISIGHNDAECFLSQKGFDELTEEKKNSGVFKRVEELFPDATEREQFVDEYSKELDQARKEITNQKETVKDCHDTFTEELMRKCHKNLIDNNLHNIVDMYNETFQLARGNWEEENNIKNLRKLAESYAILLKIEDLQAKRMKNTENVDKLVIDGILKEMERLEGVIVQQIKDMHSEHLNDILDYVPNDFEKLIKKK